MHVGTAYAVNMAWVGSPSQTRLRPTPMRMEPYCGETWETSLLAKLIFSFWINDEGQAQQVEYTLDVGYALMHGEDETASPQDVAVVQIWENGTVTP